MRANPAGLLARSAMAVAPLLGLSGSVLAQPYWVWPVVDLIYDAGTSVRAIADGELVAIQKLNCDGYDHGFGPPSRCG